MLTDPLHSVLCTVAHLLASHPTHPHRSERSSSAGIATSDLGSNEIISNDDIKKISFAAGGSQNEYDFITYVAKDKRDNRYCHVFDCSILVSLAKPFL